MRLFIWSSNHWRARSATGLWKKSCYQCRAPWGQGQGQGWISLEAVLWETITIETWRETSRGWWGVQGQQGSCWHGWGTQGKRGLGRRERQSQSNQPGQKQARSHKGGLQCCKCRLEATNVVGVIVESASEAGTKGGIIFSYGLYCLISGGKLPNC